MSQNSQVIRMGNPNRENRQSYWLGVGSPIILWVGPLVVLCGRLFSADSFESLDDFFGSKFDRCLADEQRGDRGDTVSFGSG